MTALRSRGRTAESYLAELGLVGTVMAGGLVVFLLVVGFVTFNAWPNPAGIFSNDDSTIEAGSTGDAAPASSSTPAPTIDGRRDGAGRGESADRRQAGGGGGQRSPDSTGGNTPSETGGGAPSGGAGSTGGGSTPSGGGQSGSLGNSVSNAGNQVGNAVNDVTGTNAGDAVSGAGNSAGNAVSGLGL